MTDPVAAAYEVASYTGALEQVTRTTMRNVVEGLDRERAFASQSVIAPELQSVLVEVVQPWGLHIERVEIMRIDRDGDVAR